MVMTEKLDGGNPEITITTPSKLRLKQLTGMLALGSTKRAFDASVRPRIMKMGGQIMPVGEFAATLADKLERFPDGDEGLSHLGIDLGKRIINRVVEGEHLKASALHSWNELCGEQESVSQ